METDIYQKDYCIGDLFEKVENKPGLRSSNQIKLKTKFRSRLRENSFQYPSVQLWNTAPTEVTEAKTETKARTAIRKHVKETIPI